MGYKIFSFWLLLFTLLLTACQPDKSVAQANKPQKVYRIVYEIESNEWYKTQSELWKKELDKDPKNVQAWYNYYNANRYAHFEETPYKEKRVKLRKIIEQMGKEIPDSYEYNLLRYWTECEVDDIEAIRKTYNINPNRPDTYYSMISYYATIGESDSFNIFCNRLYDSEDIEEWLMIYNYNSLLSLEQNALFFTMGDNDTYPAWLLQSVTNIRPDITILNTSLLTVKEFFTNQLIKKGYELDFDKLFKQSKNTDNEFSGKLFFQNVVNRLEEQYPEAKIYFALTIADGFFKPFKDDLYITGLAYRYSKQRFDNIALLKKNLEQVCILDYLKYDFYRDKRIAQNGSAQTELNYIPAMVSLADHYKKSSDLQKAEAWKKFALTIANRSDNIKIKEYIQEKLD